jgi:hypothetical protein
MDSPKQTAYLMLWPFIKMDKDEDEMDKAKQARTKLS